MVYPHTSVAVLAGYALDTKAGIARPMRQYRDLPEVVY